MRILSVHKEDDRLHDPKIRVTWSSCRFVSRYLFRFTKKLSPLNFVAHHLNRSCIHVYLFREVCIYVHLPRELSPKARHRLFCSVWIKSFLGVFFFFYIIMFCDIMFFCCVFAVVMPLYNILAMLFPLLIYVFIAKTLSI